jgi:ABC-type transport system involved in multi-copper enzyme maturation permease subunit
LLLVSSNLRDYRERLAGCSDFQEIGGITFEQMGNYNNYSLTGIKSIFIPSPLSVLHNSLMPAPDWKGRVNTIATLEIDENAKGKDAPPEEPPIDPFRFSFLILIFGPLMVLFYGFGAFRNVQWIRFLSRYLPPKHIFAGIAAARIVYVTLFLVLLSGLILLLFHINSLQLKAMEIQAFAVFFAAIWVLLLLFFLCGLIVSRIKRPSLAWIVLFICWLVLGLLLPSAIIMKMNRKAVTITDSNKIELEQLKIIRNFEKRSESENGKFDRGKIDKGRNLIESYWSNDFKTVERVENDLRSEVVLYMENKRDFYQWNPVTFYIATCREIGSKGNDNYIRYYDFLIALKRSFLRFFIDRCFYYNPQEMVNFIQANENLFYARSQIPANFGIGMLISFAYIFILLFISFFLFKKDLYRVKAITNLKRKRADINLLDGVANIFFVEGEDFTELLYAALSGQSETIKNAGFDGNLSFDEIDILNREKENNTQTPVVAYIPRPSDMPGDIDAAGLVTLVCGLTHASPETREQYLDAPAVKCTLNRPFKKLKKGQVFQVMLHLARLDSLNGNVYYLFNDVVEDLTLDYSGQLMNFMKELNETGNVVIFLNASASILEAPIPEDCWYYDGEAWVLQVKAFQRAQEIRGKNKN